jgi:hypothetical protein
MIQRSSRLHLALATSLLGIVTVLSGCQRADDSVIVRGLTAGDRACYLEVEDGDGQRREEMAAFELCERDDLTGRKVRLRFEKAQVQAESCQGNPDCTETETVDLVHAVEMLP